MILERIKQLCKERGISVRKFGIDIGIDSKSISRWDENRPSIDKVIVAAEYFGVSIDYLCGRTDIKETASDGGLPEDIANIIHLCRSDPRLQAFLLRQIAEYKTILADQSTE